ncbi:uncharacterized protein LOC132759792 [Ruditapes philippinarum]|uniref:uncharacterized protein LOC132759792 n=1 Tax=Ruditapes philippinarum TaxID=129788 RepID=UPI00295B27B5|nr:uncharacterized protein LOC132759792 [Ruditapes philippinarum]
MYRTHAASMPVQGQDHTYCRRKANMNLEQEKKITTAVEIDLKSDRDSVTSLEFQLNGAFVENEKHKKRITELVATCKNIEASYKLTLHSCKRINNIITLVQLWANLRLLGQEKNIRTDVENELKSATDMVQRLEKHVNDDSVKCQEHQKRIAELDAANKKLEAAYKNLDKQKYHMEQQANKNLEHMQRILLEEKMKADDQYKKLLAERDNLRDRFSKLAGKKLQEQNADIADFLDPYRAMKVSEKFGQLYDDDWTNAFESLTDKKLGVPLRDAINVLLRLLQECWAFCNKLVEAQMESLQNVFLHPAQNLANFDQKKTGLTDRPRITSKDQPSLNDLRKRVGVSPPVIEEVKQAFLADSKTWDKREEKKFDKKHIEACTPYIQKCAEVCWLMALHDPPLLMKMDVKQGEKFDTNIYTVYSQSGQTIDFLVWPPLYNGRDGGLLSKGVAEPIRVVSKKK